MTTNEALSAMGLEKQRVRSLGGVLLRTIIFRDDVEVFQGKLDEVNDWIRRQPDCPAGFMRGQAHISIGADAHIAWTTAADELGITAEMLITSVGRFILIDPDGPVSTTVRENVAAILAEPLGAFAVALDRPLVDPEPRDDPDAEQMFAEDVREWDDENLEDTIEELAP